MQTQKHITNEIRFTSLENLKRWQAEAAPRPVKLVVSKLRQYLTTITLAARSGVGSVMGATLRSDSQRTVLSVCVPLLITLTACASSPKPPERIVVPQRQIVLPPTELLSLCGENTGMTLGEVLQSQTDRLRCYIDQVKALRAWYEEMQKRSSAASS